MSPYFPRGACPYFPRLLPIPEDSKLPANTLTVNKLAVYEALPHNKIEGARNMIGIAIYAIRNKMFIVGS